MKEQKWKRFIKVWHIALVTGLLMGTSAPIIGLAEETSSQASSEIEQTTASSSKEKGTAESAIKTSQTVGNETEQTTASSEKETTSRAAADTGTKKLTILGTSDVHGQLWNYSYEDNKETPLGLAQVSSAVQAARSQNENGTVLIDNGDMIQGTILTDDLYNTREGYKDKAHPMIKAMNYMKYDAMVLGNHEFNFGLPLIEKIKSEASFPILSANTYKKADGSNFVGSTIVKELDLDGDSTSDIKVGIIGLTTPHIPQWDGDKVASLEFAALKDGAEKAVQELEGKGADVIVASIHAGRQDDDPAAAADTVINNVRGIDAYLLGHDHRSFAETVTGVDGKQIPIAGPKDTGTQMMRIDLDVAKEADQWVVKSSASQIVDTTKYPADTQLKAETEEYHNKTKEFIDAVIGKATGDFLPKEEIKGIPEAQLQPTAMISLINNVQRSVTGADLSASALFKADSKLPAGDLTYSNVFDIYKYPNTLVKAKITGENLLKYMENQAAYYNAPKPGDVTLSFNPEIRVYNYDIFSGVDYVIDVSKPVGERVTATIGGQPVDPAKEFTIAINNYRYEGLVGSGILAPDSLVLNTDPQTLRGLIVEYIKDKGTIDPAKELEDNWEVVGTNFEQNWRDLAKRLVDEGKLTIKPSADGRTPNVVPITKADIREALAAEGASQPVTIMHTNDVHGRLEENAGNKTLGMAKLKTAKESLAPTLMIDVGDVFQGLPISNYSEGRQMAKVLNEVGYDAMVVGNHEFDFGYDVAMEYKDLLNFPILSANTYKDGKPAFEASTVVERNGQKFAIIGLTTPETAVKTHPKNVEGVTFDDPLKSAIAEIDRLDSQGIDVFVVAGHLGIDETTPTKWCGDYVAKELDKAYTDKNIVFLDGHSHTESEQRFGKVLYAQTGNYLNNIGEVTVDVADPEKSTAVLHSYASLSSYEPNAAVAALVQAAKDEFDVANSEVLIPNNTIFFNGQRENVRTRETNLGNLIGDAMWAYGQEGFSEPTDFAMMNGGGIRENIEAGPITRGDIIAVLPFGNSISQIKVKGSQIKEMFEYSVRSEAQKDAGGNVITDEAGQPLLGANGGFLHISKSVKFYYDSNKKASTDASVGERVLQIEIYNRKTQEFEKLDSKKTYNMATNDFLAAGGDGYDMLGGSREEGPSLDSVLINYLQSATKLRVLDENNVDLNDYQVELSQDRIIPMSEAKFNELNKPAPEPGKDGEDGKDGENGQNGQNGQKGDEGDQGDPGKTGAGTDGKTGTDGKENQTGVITHTAQPVSNKKQYPSTGEKVAAYGFAGLLVVAGSAGTWIWYNKRKAS
ncbi:5'-nucleotidase C-terminal domain-containing protein [Candidatus Enterococcus ferrettii]|uniref:Multifunctional 2',3'-cyclic-nucleotide 2'-phosphodiesterase/5'-nucleotidase/3'-nucleotidase n=1 Tax=Candidatus Enterococcus ferrettii TaxID=2815324 RepID=A0ABV0ELX5_9ENTE|nr:5'-nucleotidase C-terminal domain-containing protein [Enterococcus sp. 665A]